jgi:hypothetical protein
MPTAPSTPPAPAVDEAAPSPALVPAPASSSDATSSPPSPAIDESAPAPAAPAAPAAPDSSSTDDATSASSSESLPDVGSETLGRPDGNGNRNDNQHDKSEHLSCPGEKVIVIHHNIFQDNLGDAHDLGVGSGKQEIGSGKQGPHDMKMGNAPDEDEVLVTYCFRITNIGNTFLFPITLTDNTLNRKKILVNSGNPSIPLAPNDDITFILKDFPISKTTRNTAFVVAQPSDAEGHRLNLDPVRDQDSALVIIRDVKNHNKNELGDHKNDGKGIPPPGMPRKNQDGHN